MLTRERIENEKKELQIMVDRDRDCMGKKFAEEHDQRRIEQMEMTVSHFIIKQCEVMMFNCESL